MKSTNQVLPLAGKAEQSKGQPVRLGRAGNGGLKQVTIGTIFDVRLSATGCDVDLCAFAVHEKQGGVRPEATVSYFNQRSVLDGAIELAPDDRTGAMFFDETLWVRARAVPDSVERIVVAVFIYRKGKRMGAHFGGFHNVDVFLETGTGRELLSVRFDCSPEGEGAGKTAVVLGEMYRQDGDWMFKPSGHARVGWMPALCRSHGVEVKKAA